MPKQHVLSDGEHMSVVPEPLPIRDGWKIQLNPFMPPGHIMCSPDVYDVILQDQLIRVAADRLKVSE